MDPYQLSHITSSSTSRNVHVADSLLQMFLVLPADGVSQAVDHTCCPGATWRRVARVWLFNTTLVFTDKAPITVRIPHALRTTSSDCIWLGNVVGNTPADGIAVGTLLAGSVWAAWSWVTRVLWCRRSLPEQKKPMSQKVLLQ